MSRSFSNEDITSLKGKLRLRAPAYRFTEEDVAALEAGTGHSAARIVKWAENLNQRFTTDAAKERFFSDVQVI